MANLTTEKLFSALPQTKPYTLKGDHALKGEKVVVQALSAEGYTAWMAATDPSDSRGILLAYGLAEPKIGPADIERLGQLEATVLIELTNAVLAFNGFGAPIPAEGEVAEGDDSFRG